MSENRQFQKKYILKIFFFNKRDEIVEINEFISEKFSLKIAVRKILLDKFLEYFLTKKSKKKKG